MAMYDVSLSASEANKTSTGPVSLGGTRGGGQSFSFGGINDSPGGVKWLWPVLGGLLLIGAVAMWWTTRKSK